MLINFFKIFFSILLIIYQIPVYSKNNYINEFNYKDLSNYFSAKVSYDNQKNVDALKFFKSSKSLINKHNPYLKQYIFSLILEGKVNTAIKELKSNENKKYYGIQFHPEVSHTENGKVIIKNFLFNICKFKHLWNPKNQKELLIANIKKRVQNEKVICALSGGVDSSVVALLLKKAINKNLICIFVNTGLLRKNEAKEVISTFKKKFKIKFISEKRYEIFKSMSLIWKRCSYDRLQEY